jgi:hypothetical protein
MVAVERSGQQLLIAHAVSCCPCLLACNRPPPTPDPDPRRHVTTCQRRRGQLFR